MAASKQASKHAHACAQCSPASVVLAQARPNYPKDHDELWQAMDDPTVVLQGSVYIYAKPKSTMLLNIELQNVGRMKSKFRNPTPISKNQKFWILNHVDCISFMF